MRGAVDHDELLRLLELRVELAYSLQRNQLVTFPVDDELRLARELYRRELVSIDWRRDADQGADAIVVRASRHRDVRAEGKARGPQLQIRILRGHEIDGGPVVGQLALSLVPGAAAA